MYTSQLHIRYLDVDGVEGVLYGEHKALVPHGVEISVYRLGLVEKAAVALELYVGVTGS